MVRRPGARTFWRPYDDTSPWHCYVTGPGGILFALCGAKRLSLCFGAEVKRPPEEKRCEECDRLEAESTQRRRPTSANWKEW